jgi:hypothetical protein
VAQEAVAVIVSILGKEDPNAGVVDPQPLPCIAAPWDWPSIGAVLINDGVIVPVSIRSVRDDSWYQGLRDFKVHEPLAARSSSIHDTDVHVIGNLLEKEANMRDTTVAVMADTEYLLLYVRALFLEPERLQNLYLLAPLFHSRMHALVNTSADPVAALLIVLPFSYAIGCRRKKIKVMHRDALAVVKAYNRGYERAAADAATPADAATAGLSAAQAVTAGQAAAHVATAMINAAIVGGGGVVGRAPRAPRTPRIPTNFVQLAELDIAKQQGLPVPAAAAAHVAALDEDDLGNGDDDEEEEEEEEEEEVNTGILENMFSPEELRSIVHQVYLFIARGGREKGVGFSYKEMKLKSISYTTCLFLMQQLVASFTRVEGNLAPSSWASRLVVDFLDKAIRQLGIRPGAEIIRHGNAVPYLESLHLQVGVVTHAWKHTNRIIYTFINTIHYTLYNIHYTLYTMYYVLFTIHYTLYPIPYTLCTMYYVLYPIPYVLYPIPYVLCTIQSIGTAYGTLPQGQGGALSGGCGRPAATSCPGAPRPGGHVPGKLQKV